MHRAIGCWQPWRGVAARATTRSKAACSWAARRCSGYAMAWASSNGPTTSKPWPPPCPIPAMSTWCRAFAGLGAPQWDAAARGTIIGLTRGSTRGPHRARRAGGHCVPRPPISSMQCARTRAAVSASSGSTAARRVMTCCCNSRLTSWRAGVAAEEYRDHRIWCRALAGWASALWQDEKRSGLALVAGSTLRTADEPLRGGFSPRALVPGAGPIPRLGRARSEHVAPPARSVCGRRRAHSRRDLVLATADASLHRRRSGAIRRTVSGTAGG